MKAILENGMLYITPKDKEEERELNKWYNRTYKSYDEMDDFMVYIEPVKNNEVAAPVSLDEQSEAMVCRCTTHWCMVMDKKTLTCSVNDFDCEERQTGN